MKYIRQSSQASWYMKDGANKRVQWGQTRLLLSKLPEKDTRASPRLSANSSTPVNASENVSVLCIHRCMCMQQHHVKVPLVRTRTFSMHLFGSVERTRITRQTRIGYIGHLFRATTPQTGTARNKQNGLQTYMSKSVNTGCLYLRPSSQSKCPWVAKEFSNCPLQCQRKILRHWRNPHTIEEDIRRQEGGEMKRRETDR